MKTFFAVIALVALVACGGGSKTIFDTPFATWSIQGGGTLSLAPTSLNKISGQLVSNGATQIVSDGTWTQGSEGHADASGTLVTQVVTQASPGVYATSYTNPTPFSVSLADNGLTLNGSIGGKAFTAARGGL